MAALVYLSQFGLVWLPSFCWSWLLNLLFQTVYVVVVIIIIEARFEWLHFVLLLVMNSTPAVNGDGSVGFWKATASLYAADSEDDAVVGAGVAGP